MSIVAYTFFFGRYESSPAITYRRRPSMKSTQQQSELEKEKKKSFHFLFSLSSAGDAHRHWLLSIDPFLAIAKVVESWAWKQATDNSGSQTKNSTDQLVTAIAIKPSHFSSSSSTSSFCLLYLSFPVITLSLHSSPTVTAIIVFHPLRHSVSLAPDITALSYFVAFP